MGRGTGLLIRKLRKDFKLTSSELAKIIDVNKSSISKREKTGEVAIENLYKLSRVFMVTLQELIDGKLILEGKTEYFERNYNLNLYDLEKSIKYKRIDELVEFYEKCSYIRARYKELIILKAFNPLDKDQEEELNFLERFISVDYFAASTLYRSKQYIFGANYERKNSEDEIKSILIEISYLPKEERDRELDKLLKFKIDLKLEEAIKIESLEVFNAILKTFNQSFKDSLFKNLILQPKEVDDNDDYIKTLLSGGCNAIYDFNIFSVRENDREIVDEMEGDSVEDNDYYSFINSAEFKDIENINAGKDYVLIYTICSYSLYRKMINKKKTRYYNDMYFLKEKNPNEYLENLINGEYDLDD